MMHGQNGHMAGDCLFSATEVSLCPTDAVAMVAYHISAYHSFLNVIINSNSLVLLVSLLLAVFAIFTFYTSPILLVPLLPAGSMYCSPPVCSRDRRVTRWLSLFENSPASV